MIYFDFNATTPVDERVLDGMVSAYRTNVGNPDSRTHEHGNQCRKIVEAARADVAEVSNVEAAGVRFTSGATESNNLAIFGLARYGKSIGRTHVITSSIEHKSVLKPILALEQYGFDVDIIPASQSGKISASDVLERVRQDTLLVSIMHVNNETGVIQPVRDVGEAMSELFPDVFLHIDAAQSFGKLVPEIANMQYDLMSVTAHKLYGPQGVGALLMRRKKYSFPAIQPLQFGGNQEKGLRPGTQPTALIKAFGDATRLCGNEYEADLAHELRIKTKLLSILEDSGVRFEVNGDQNDCLPSCLNVGFPGVSSEALLISAKHYMSMSNGSACDSSSYEPSYVLKAMGLGEKRASEALRISWGRMTDYDQAAAAFENLVTIAAQLQR